MPITMSFHSALCAAKVQRFYPDEQTKAEQLLEKLSLQSMGRKERLYSPYWMGEWGGYSQQLSR